MKLLKVLIQKYKMAIITICKHCSTECSGKYCPDCTTADKRREQDENNRKHFEECGLPLYICKVCVSEQTARDDIKERKLKYGI